MSWIIIVSSFYVDDELSEVGGKVSKVQEIEVNVNVNVNVNVRR